MEKKYLLVNTEDIKNGASVKADGAEVVYVVDSPFKRYLYDEVIKEMKKNGCKGTDGGCQ